MENKPTKQTYLVGTLILSVVAIILVIFTDWGGYYYGGYYYEEWGWIYLFTGAGFFPLFLCIAIFSFVAYISYLGLRTPERLSDRFILYGLLGSIIIVIVNIFGLIIFGLWASDSDWWMDAAFYASFIGGLLNSIFFHLIRKG